MSWEEHSTCIIEEVMLFELLSVDVDVVGLALEADFHRGDRWV